MSVFGLEILTPEKQVFEGMVEAAICPTSAGDIEILKGHQNLVAALGNDEIKLKIDGEWHIFVVESGFFEVRPEGVIIFAKYCETLENYEEAKEKRKQDIEKSRRYHAENVSFQKTNDISLSKLILSTHKTKTYINI